jgi:thiol-disulfide isomerase/thioredoxin
MGRLAGITGDTFGLSKRELSFMNQVVESPRPLALWALACVALGLAALVIVLATFIIMQENQDIRPVVMVAYSAFFAAGLCCPRRGVASNWRGAILVSVGGILPGVALKAFQLAFSDNFYAGLMATTAIVAVLVGIGARSLVSRRRFALAGVICCLSLTLCVAAALGVVPLLLDQRAYIEVDRPIEPFSVRTLDGKSLNSDTWRGRVVVLSYWATWCTPCLAEIPEVAALQRKYEDDPRVAVVALNAGYGGDTAQKARDFLVRRHFALASEIDDIKTEGSPKGEAALHLGLKVVPTLFILTKDHRVVAVHVGFDSSEHLVASLSKRIDSLIRTPQ